ncbi:MAG: GspE/PulE family protein [Patescibacteria group bacterium]
MPDLNKTIFYLNREQEERHTQELAKKLNLPYINLSNYPIAPEILNLISKEIALRFQIIPYLKIGSTVKIGTANPSDDAMASYLAELERTSKLKFVKSLISKASLFYGILAYENKEKEEKKKAEETKESGQNFTEEIKDLESAASVARSVSTTHLLEVIMTGAAKTNASDIHLEPTEKEFIIRYRIDGVLQNVVSLPMSQYKSLLSRIKFLSKLKMDNAIEPQDGRFSFKFGEEPIDLRVSTLPSADGESVVIRLLRQTGSILSLKNLGIRPDALSVIEAAISKPHGMILTSGPTGSGKSSTLYAILHELNKSNVKIITLEDPVEYHIPGVEQSQVEKEEGYTFALGLRASLRQDPDILMVGEVRDTETAEIAIQAAMTGHLLLSTIHANSAPGVFVRLLDIGVKPFLLSGSINLVMAQRLVRRICPACAEEYTPSPEVWKEIQDSLLPIQKLLDPASQNLLSSAAPKLKRGKGCGKCRNVGFSGRQVIIEVLVPNESIDKLLFEKAGLSEFTKAALSSGMITMEQDGLSKVLSGVTTAEEVWRVTKD